ncbi:hypothetical protein J3E68DRAFT_36927 [Trichoderma sp. SZMC 28012]
MQLRRLFLSLVARARAFTCYGLPSVSSNTSTVVVLSTSTHQTSTSYSAYMRHRWHHLATSVIERLIGALAKGLAERLGELFD